MILCHKCKGVLSYGDGEDTTDLLNCQCLSGWVRGFEPHQTREQAIVSQIEQQWSWIELYQNQRRSEDQIYAVLAKIIKLEELSTAVKV